MMRNSCALISRQMSDVKIDAILSLVSMIPVFLSSIEGKDAEKEQGERGNDVFLCLFPLIP